jgi:diguanylate cyclase (GGDEF)-like protein
MLSDEHTETIVAIAVAVIAAVFLIALDAWPAKVAGVMAVAVLAALVWRADQRRRSVEHERDEVERRVLDLDDRDPLTGAVRARRLEEELRRQLALAQRNRSRVAVLAVDLGGFEPAVDAYGRATGDEMLLAGAEVLREELRASDLITRPRHDAFVVVLPDTDEDAARIVAGKLIRSLRGVKRPRPDGALIDLRASIGLALSDPSSPSDAEGLLGAADAALASAKGAGGDRFAVNHSLVVD